MVRLETDAQLVNKIANSPGVLPYIKPEGGASDWTAACANRFSLTGVILLSNCVDAVGVFEATAIAPPFQAFQMHTLFGATCRGRKAIATGKEMLAWLFAHGATLVWGATPLGNRAARWFNRQIGGRATGADAEFEYFELRTA